ncbi:hypothetical protein B7494_g557 [Chlorociboria aeruginascens]|nr:hypothetical protein B7494_g557 [Chlorociboria aeruginascens]
MTYKNKTKVLPTTAYPQGKQLHSQTSDPTSAFVAERSYISSPSSNDGVAVDRAVSDPSWNVASSAEYNPSSDYQIFEDPHASEGYWQALSQVGSASTQSSAPYISSSQVPNKQDVSPMDRAGASSSIRQHHFIDSHPQARQLSATPRSFDMALQAQSDRRIHNRHPRQHLRTSTYSTPSASASSTASRPSSTTSPSTTSTIEPEASVQYGDEYLGIGAHILYYSGEAYPQTLIVEDEEGVGVATERVTLSELSVKD